MTRPHRHEDKDENGSITNTGENNHAGEEGSEEESPCEKNPSLPRCNYVLLLEETGRYLAIMFIIALVIAAGLLAVGRESLANKAAEYAYYLLVASVLSLIASTALEPRKEGEEGGFLEEKEPVPEIRDEKPVEEDKSLITITGFISLVRTRTSRVRMVLSKVMSSVEKGIREHLAQPPAILMAISIVSLTGTLVITGTQLGLSPVPGRPTILVNPFDWSPLFPIVAVGFALLGWPIVVLGGGISWGLVFAAMLLVSLGLGWFSPLPLAILLYSLYKVLAPRQLLWTASLSLALLAIIGLMRPYHTWLSSWGWAGLTVSSIVALVLIFVGLSQVLLIRVMRLGEPGASTEEKRIVDLRHNVPLKFHQVRQEALGVLLVAFLASFLIVSTVHARVGGIVSLDTIYHTAMCISYDIGKSGLTDWERPLFTYVSCNLGKLVGDYFYLFDKIWPLFGFTLLTTVVYIVARLEGISQRGSIYAAILTLAYWTPFFIYAGFQTNLVALPLAFVLARMASIDIEAGWRPATTLLALVLVLLHPWTLAYYTLGLFVYYLVATPWSKGWLLKKGRVIALELIPAWAVYAILYSGKETYSIAGIASSILFASGSGGFDVVNALTVFAWGTALRGDVLLPFALAIILITFREQSGYVISWPILLSLISGLGVFLFNQGALIVRLLMDMPLPLALVWIFEKEFRFDSRSLAIISIAPVVVMLYYFYFAPMTPIGLDPVKILGELIK